MNTNTTVNRLPSIDGFQVPQVILQHATTLDTNYSFFDIDVAADGNLAAKSLELLPIFHFAEIASDSANRTFNVYSAGELLFPNLSPLPMRLESMYPVDRFLRASNTSFILRKVLSSRLPPLINAFEGYSLVRMDNFTTSSDDGKISNEWIRDATA